MNPLKIGLFGIGLDAYWPQFPGLKERLESGSSWISGGYNPEFAATPFGISTYLS